MRQRWASPIRALWVLIAIVVVASAAVPAWAISLQEEIDLGQKVDAEILRQTPLSTNDQAIKQMEEWGQKLVKNVRRPEIKYHFRIIKENDYNAFAVPGGYVYFTEKLWNMMTKDERIGVMAHEIEHVDGRHALDAISKQRRRQLWLLVLLGALGAGETAYDIAGLAEMMYTLKYSRGDERQADEVGVELTEAAGYNPAGLLLAMRKIKRLEDERGGKTPKVFSSHPPTKERLDYLEALLRKKGVPIPGDQVKDIANPYKIGSVTSVKGNTVQFSSTKPLQAGQVVWLMAVGWDYHYENKTAVPIARAAVTSTGTTYSAHISSMPAAKKNKVQTGVGVYDPPRPAAVIGIGTLEPLGALGKLESTEQLAKFDRLLAVQVVWKDDLTNLVHDNVGYLVVRNPANPTGYVSVSRPAYSYAPLGDHSTLVRLADPDQARWIGPVISIGRGGETVEVVPIRPVEQDRTYEVVVPAWDPNESYEKRVVGTAKLRSTSGKIVLKMTTYTGGWSIDDVRNGFDVYEKAAGG